MELRQLKTFQTVAATLSFTQAASALGYVQSSVTAQMQALEADFGVALFNRLGKRIVLTDAGERLLTYAQRILALAEEARAAVPGGPDLTGTLVVGAPETFCTYRLPAILQQFRTRFPGVRLQLSACPLPDLLRGVSEGRLDVAFVIEGALQATGLAVETLVAEPGLLVAAPDHRLAQVRRVAAQDLAEEQVLFKEPKCVYGKALEEALVRAGIYPSAALSFSSLEAIKQCVMAGMGVSLLPAVSVAEEVAQGRLAVLDWAGPSCDVLSQVVYHEQRKLPSLTAFLGVVHDVLKA